MCAPPPCAPQPLFVGFFQRKEIRKPQLEQQAAQRMAMANAQVWGQEALLLKSPISPEMP